MTENKMFTFDTNKGVVKTFEIYKLIPENDAFLKKPTIPFDFKNPQVNPVYLGMSLFETMFHNKGVGLTANQVGLPYSVFVIGYDKDNKQIFFNPIITESSEEEVSEIEGCLSFDKLYMHVRRPKTIKIKFQHVTGEEKEETFTGLTARIIQHEYDHTKGITFTDRAGKVTFMMANEKRKKLFKKLKRMGK